MLADVCTGMELTYDERDLILAGLFELTITYGEDDEKTRTVQGSCREARGRCGSDVLQGGVAGTATVSSTWRIYGRPVCGVVSVLFTRDRRVFLMHDDGSIREAVDWERDEVLLQMLSRRDSVTQR